MGWRRSFEFYRRRKQEARRPLLEDPLFKRFIAFIEWRKGRGDVA